MRGSREADSTATGGVDGGAGHLANALRRVPIAHRVERARSLYREVQPRALCEVLRIHIAAMPVGWNSRERTRLTRSEANLATKRRQGNPYTRRKFGPAIRPALKTPYLERGFWKFVGQ